MNEQDLKFCQDHIVHLEAAKLGFGNMPFHILAEFEAIYKRNVMQGFVLTSWCQSCVLDMMKRLAAYYETLPVSEPIQPKTETFVNPNHEKPKKGRPKRS